MLRNSPCSSSNRECRNCRSRIPRGLINIVMNLSTSSTILRSFNRIYSLSLNLNLGRILDLSPTLNLNIKIQCRTIIVDLNQARNIKVKPTVWLKINLFKKKIQILLSSLKQWLRSQLGLFINMVNLPSRNKLDIELLQKRSSRRKNFGRF